MLYQATAKYVRMSPRKVRLVADSIRGFMPERAVRILSTTTKRAAKPLAKVIASALANARGKADPSKMSFAKIEVMGGGAIKLWQPVSRGMAHGYKKRMTHIRVVLTDEKTVNNSSLK